MKKLVFLVLALQTVFAFGQKPSNNLVGTFENQGKKNKYASFNFDGKGKVTVNNKDKFEFFEKNDSIYVLHEDDLLAFVKTNDNQLKGLSKKIDKSTYATRDRGFKYEKTSVAGDKRADLVEQYYQVNYTRANKMFAKKKKGNFLSSMQTMKKENQRLCDLDLDLGCVQIFVYSLGDKSLGLISVLFDSSAKEVQDIKPDEELEKLGYKIIDLGNAEGYGLLYSYYTLIGKDDKAKTINDKGIKEGCKVCLSNK